MRRSLDRALDRAEAAMSALEVELKAESKQGMAGEDEHGIDPLTILTIISLSVKLIEWLKKRRNR